MHADLLGRALHWAITDDVFHPVRKHGNTTWLPRSLIVQAIFWVWSSCHKLTEGFEEARQLSQRVWVAQPSVPTKVSPKRCYVIRHSSCHYFGNDYWTLMQECGAEHWRIGPWLPLAVDGSRVTTPRTKSNEQARAPRTMARPSACIACVGAWKSSSDL